MTIPVIVDELSQPDPDFAAWLASGEFGDTVYVLMCADIPVGVYSTPELAKEAQFNLVDKGNGLTDFLFKTISFKLDAAAVINYIRGKDGRKSN